MLDRRTFIACVAGALLTTPFAARAQLGAPRSTTVVITKPSVLLVLNVANFRVLAGKRPELVTMIEDEGRRRRETNAALHHA